MSTKYILITVEISKMTFTFGNISLYLTSNLKMLEMLDLG